MINTPFIFYVIKAEIHTAFALLYHIFEYITIDYAKIAVYFF